MTYLGIDFGTKRIGLALATDETPSVPYGTLQITLPCRQAGNYPALPAGRQAITKIINVIQKEHIDVVVVGRPRSMGRSEKTEIEKKTEEFVNVLMSYRLPLTSIVLEDERLTSKAADALRKEHGASGDRDAVAAMLILESFLGRRKSKMEEIV